METIHFLNPTSAGGLLLPAGIEVDEHIEMPAAPAADTEQVADVSEIDELARCAEEIVVTECPGLFDDWVRRVSGIDTEQNEEVR